MKFFVVPRHSTRLASIFASAITLLAVLHVAGCVALPAAPIPSPPQPKAPAVGFDIDGTLTPDVLAFTEARVDAALAVERYAAKGYKVIYISTRLSFLQGGIPNWLKDKGFPAGSLHVAQTDNEHHNPAIFKAAVMKEFSAKGWRLVGGYGDSSTDFEAYAAAGIPQARVFALQRRSESNCQPGVWEKCLHGWTEHLSYIDARTD